MNPIELNSYQAVSQCERIDKQVGTMEQGNKMRQIMVGVIANIASAVVGTTLGWTSPVAPKLQDESHSDSPLDFVPTKDEMSWISSLVPLGALVAPYIAGPLAGMVGRKYTLLSSSILFIVSWILLLTTKTVMQMYVARLLQGFGVGFVMTVQTMYIGEIASDEVRGALGSFMQLFIVTGILYVYAIGPFVGYYVFQYFCLALPIIFAGLFFFMPESPAYLISKGRKEDAISSLKYLRGMSEEGVQDELATIQASVEEAMKNKAGIGDLFQSKGNLKALIISAGLLSFQQLSGINAVLFYSQSIFQRAGGALAPEIATILVGLVMVIFSGLTPLIADRLGRKPILLVSSAGMTISLGCMGLYFLVSQECDAKSIATLPVFSLLVFVAVYCVGFGPLPWAVHGEMFAPNVKSVASSIVTSICWILGFLVTRFFEDLDTAVGSHWSFWIFGLFCAGAFAFTMIVVMETKGLSLQEIQDRLNGKA